MESTNDIQEEIATPIILTPHRNPWCPNCGDDWDDKSGHYKCGTSYDQATTKYDVSDLCMKNAEVLSKITEADLDEMRQMIADKIGVEIPDKEASDVVPD